MNIYLVEVTYTRKRYDGRKISITISQLIAGETALKAKQNFLSQTKYLHETFLGNNTKAKIIKTNCIYSPTK